MSVHILLLTLEDYLTTKKAVEAGIKTEQALLESKKTFAQALNKYIDWRADGVLEERGRRVSSYSGIKVAELATGTIDISSIEALNSAPNPPDNIGKLTAAGLDKWFETYKIWYNNVRKKGMKV